MKLYYTLEDKFEGLFGWLNEEATDTKTKVAQISVVFGLLGLCIIGVGFAS